MKDFSILPFQSLANFTSWHIGGPAEWLAEPKNINELSQIVKWSKDKGIACTVIGAGSNLLISDSGVKGLSICTKKMQGSNCHVEDGVIEALAGEPIPRLARTAAKAGLSGLEWSVGIPGTVGGAAVMNAGAQNSCISECLTSIKVLSPKEGKIFELKNQDLNFGYRSSLLQTNELIVLSAAFDLQKGCDPEKLIEITNNNLQKRTKSQPYHLPSCGSVFRNPEPLKAGKLIEELGLKGFSFGGAEISRIHANFIINANKASSTDVQELIQYIQKKVLHTYGILLETEVKQCGF